MLCDEVQQTVTISTNPQEEECPVCFETFTNKIRTVFPCGHYTCMSCLTQLIGSPSCPMCRCDLSSTVCLRRKPPTRHSSMSRAPYVPSMRYPLPSAQVPSASSHPTSLMSRSHGSNVLSSLFSRPRSGAWPSGGVGVQSNREALVIFDMDETSDDENDLPRLPMTTRSMLASIRVRPLQNDDILNARVTRRSIFLRR